jgi:hypothetical protein
MTATWADLKAELVDLGFEEDDTVRSEYNRIVINSVNRALDVVYNIVVPQIESYYKLTESWGYEGDDGDWILPKPKHVTENTEDTQKINIADNLYPLIPLLAAHYIWLDDDVTKATLYWNEYDQLKDQIIMVCRQPRKAQIEGGIRWY